MRHGQGRRVIKLFWETVLVSALNERIGQMDVGYARKVFLDGFLCNRDGFQLEIPIVPLGELYGKRLESWLENQGVTVHLKTGIREIECDDDGSVCGVRFRTGKSLDADLIVLAVPFDRVLRLVPEALQEDARSSGSRLPVRVSDRGSTPLVRPVGVSLRPRRDSGAADPVGVQPHRDSGARCDEFHSFARHFVE